MVKHELDPDEIFLDSGNLPAFNVHQFEGRLEKAISKKSLIFLGLFFLLLGVVYAGRVTFLQAFKGEAYALRSEDNRLHQQAIFAKRGVIYDRNKEVLATNGENGREYALRTGLAHILGYVGLPDEEEIEKYFPEEEVGKAGVEKEYNDLLRGEHGLRIEEVKATGEIVSENIQVAAKAGENVTLSIDARVNEKLYEVIKAAAIDRGFRGGAGVIMDVTSGSILALASYPEFDPNVLSGNSDNGDVSLYLKDPKKPFLNRVVSGLYTPGSIVKPFMAIAALTEGVITPDKQILSTGQIEVPNPYNPEDKSIFKDWKAHGWLDMRHAIGHSSNVYFYEVGGGYPGQKGIGISNIEKYMNLFGFASKTGIDLAGEEDGLVPSPEWKEKVFDDIWRLGDTYHTSIGQYGFQVTPLQMARAVAALANGGILVTPRLIQTNLEVPTQKLIDLPLENFKVVREGMKLSVTEGTAVGLSSLPMTLGAKTGTAELGVSKERVNSWVTGFFPYENPRYAFALVMEQGPRANTIGGVSVMRSLLDWMIVYTPEYLK